MRWYRFRGPVTDTGTIRNTVFIFFIFNSFESLWGNAEDVVGYVDRGSVDLFMSSPPYPLNSPREYGNPTEAAWVTG
jgi:site-specific DNA-methyltransferase (cytosine-N4-specific)